MKLTHRETDMDDIDLITDKEVARIFCMSSSWTRGQRFKRKNGESHFLAVDPIYIGKCPRYKKYEIMNFLRNVHAQCVEA